MNNFSKLGLSAEVVQVLTSIGFETPTPIQEQAIPMLLTKNPTDFIGLAQTGTGKTAAFGLPLIDLIDAESKRTQALIMAPTRELAQQTAKQLEMFSRNQPLNVVVVYGGQDINRQIKALKKPTQIVVATPGRLLDLIKRKAVDLESVRYAILDEADEMLNMGFQEDIDSILEHTPDHRVTWLFSATMPKEIRKIVKTYMADPVEVSVNTEQKVNKDIEHQYVVVTRANKMAALKRFLDLQPEMRGILFCRTRWETREIADQLGNQGYSCEALHGDLSQAQRDAVMSRFKKRSMQLLIATDVAARGIDVNDLTHVIHHQLPDQLEAYTHRSGRTGRAGKKGISMAFINSREGRKIKDIEKRNEITFTKVEVPSLESLKAKRIHNWAKLIAGTKVDKQSDEILREIEGHFMNLDKEDILKRLITTQLDHLMVQGDSGADLNEKTGPKKTREDRSEGPERKSGAGDVNRYFINIGSIDGVTKGDLLHFLSDVSGIKRKHFGDIRLQKNCAFFDVPADKDKKLEPSFVGVEVDGRSIRVNLDDGPGGGGPPAKSRASSYRGKGRPGGRPVRKGHKGPKGRKGGRR